MKALKKAGFVLASILFLIFILGPFIYTFIIAISPKTAMFTPDAHLLPESITWDNFADLFSGSKRGSAFFRGMGNSLSAVFITLVIGIPITVMSGYALSRWDFKGRKFIKNALLITIVIPVMATIIPLYRMFALGGMLDNMFWLSVIYVSSYLPMATWMMTNYLSTIPVEIEEAAMIAIRTVNQFIEEHPGELELVEWVLFDQNTYETYDKVLSKLQISKIVSSPRLDEINRMLRDGAF